MYMYCFAEGAIIHVDQLLELLFALQARKSAPLARGGTLKGEKAAGKVAHYLS